MSSTATDASASSAASSLASSLASSASAALSTAASLTSNSFNPTGTEAAASTQTAESQAGSAQKDKGIGIVSFLTAVGVAMAVFAAQILLFLILRNKLARILYVEASYSHVYMLTSPNSKPKTYLVPERERTEPPPRGFFGMLRTLAKFSDREVIDKCGLDAYFFLRYLRTMLIIFIPICAVVMPILIPINYVGGQGHDIDVKQNETSKSNSTTIPTGLDTLAWGNVSPKNTNRYGAHLLMAILVIIWVCTVFFFELRVYIKVRQDYLTSAEHRLRASATTVLVSGIPGKWLSEDALRGLFDVFPGGVRNIWLNRDLSKLLDKVHLRNKIHKKLESAETDLIKAAKKAQLKKRDRDEKKQRKEMHLGNVSKQEKAARHAQEDQIAQKMAERGEGTAAGDKHDVPHTIDASVRQSRYETLEHEHQHQHEEEEREKSKLAKIPLIGDPLAKVGHGLKGIVTKAGNEVDGTLETTNGFTGIDESNDVDRSESRTSDRYRLHVSHDEEQGRPSASDTLRTNDGHRRTTSGATADSSSHIRPKASHDFGGNTTRKVENIDDMYITKETKWWQFWKPPTGGYASPIPQGTEAQDYMTAKANEKKTFWQVVKSAIPFVGGEEEETYEYSQAYNTDYKEDQEEKAMWEVYLKKKDRPTHNLPLFGKNWLFGIPFVTKKVDTIYWCREELARLNVEIEEDQDHPERFPLMNSAFIQFNHQVAAHMACQSAIHHVPKKMTPRICEISPKDVIWDNMALSWWSEWARAALVTVLVCAMIFLWAIPVAWTAALSQLDTLIQNNDWLSFIKDNKTLENAAKAIAGVLPAVVLGLLLFLVPIILDFLGKFKGAKTGSQRIEFVQVFYFAFLFVQVFLIVSIASFFAASIDQLVHNVQKLNTVQAVLDLLATNLPTAANYFFSYMILQALSTSSGTLLQIGALLVWYIIARILDSTARNKWTRNTKLNQVKWGSFFPIYTNFACIALIYCVVAPLISIFAIITFSLLWLAQRYAMLYVTRFEHDTGGVLYPRAINQTFTGIYFMELCMAGLFLIVKDENDKNTCIPHGIVMIVVLFLTIAYQFLLNWSFGPLLRYLPITFEDEAVIRDEAFQRAQDRRLGLLEEEDEESEDDLDSEVGGQEKVRMRRFRSLHRVRKTGNKMGTWAKDGGHQLRKLAAINRNKDQDKNKRASEYRRMQRQKDIEAQRAIGDALYGGIHDEIEDLTPEERDALTRHAFLHEALRARRPTVWIPRDDLGVSDDEIRRTQDYSEHIWISNEGTALDSKCRVVYGKNPPDFSEVDLINL